MLKQMNLFRANPIGVVRVGVVGVGFVALLLGVSGAVNVVVAASRTLSASTYVDKQTQAGLTAGAGVELAARCRPGDKVLSGGLDTPLGGVLMASKPMKRSGDSMVDVADGGSADAWQIYWVPDFSAPASSVDVFAICTGVSRR